MDDIKSNENGETKNPNEEPENLEEGAGEAEKPPEQENGEEVKRTVGVGIDKEGYFRLKIYANQSPWTVIGFIEESKAVYRQYVMAREQQKAQAKKVQGILKPGGNNKRKTPFNFWRR